MQMEGKRSGAAVERSTTPKVSVCMTVYNGEDHVADQLAALAAQDYQGEWELIVADDGSSDATLEVLRTWEESLPLIISPGPNHGRPNPGRNRARGLASGELLAFCDHDDRVRPEWISSLVRTARSFDVIAGVTDCGPLNDPVVRSWKDDRPTDELVVAHGALPGMIGASCAVWADVFDAINGFNPSVFGHDDVDFAWRAQFAGFSIGLAADAIVDYRYRPTIRGLAKQSYQRYLSVPSLLAIHAEQLTVQTSNGNSATPRSVVTNLMTTAPRALLDRSARGRWVHTAARLAGYLAGSWQVRTGRSTFVNEWPRFDA